MALVLLDLIGPSRSHAAFGSRRGKLSHSHDTVRSETRNKPASPMRPIGSLSLGFLGAIDSLRGRAVRESYSSTTPLELLSGGGSALIAASQRAGPINAHRRLIGPLLYLFQRRLGEGDGAFEHGGEHVGPAVSA